MALIPSLVKLKGFTDVNIRNDFICSIFLTALNQRTNGPVNAHLISGPSISTKHTKPG